MSRQCRFTIVFSLLVSMMPSALSAATSEVVNQTAETVNQTAEAPHQTAEALTLLAQGFVEELVTQKFPEASRIEITAKSPDKRLDLTGCNDPQLALHGSQKIGRRVLVKVSCANSLAIHLSVDIQVLKSVVAAERSLPRGTLLSSRDVIPVETDILNSGRHYLFNIEDATGQNLKRSVREGALLTAGMLAQPELVGRGDAVIITAHRGSLKVRMPGTALSSGAMGEQVSVRNTKTDRVVRGLVAARGEVTVRF